MFDLVTGTETKARLSVNMLPNIETFTNSWSNISENLRKVAIKLFALIQFASPNHTKYFNFVM